jgi:hypothetical protein
VASRLRRHLPLARARLVITFRGPGEELETDSGVPARRCGRHGRRLVRRRPAIPSLLPGYRLRRHHPTTRGLDLPSFSIWFDPVILCADVCCPLLGLGAPFHHWPALIALCSLQHSISITGRF